MFLQVGFLGHVLTLELNLTPDEPEEEETVDGIGGGSGGSFERFTEQPLEYFEGEEEWEERLQGFGFA